MARHDHQGFILPLAVLLVVILTISGTAFMQHDYLERRMVMNTVDNHGGFYLANAGMERARETFKIPNDFTWTSVLNGAYDGPINPGPDYPVDPAPVFCPLCLCGANSTSGCVMPSFGALVASGIPFDPTFDDGQYEVRAFNNEPGTTDTDQQLTIRALGTLRGEQKLLEVEVLAVSGLDLINCLGSPSTPCPTRINGRPTRDPADGRDPSSHLALPALTYPLTDARNYYRPETQAANFPSLTQRTYAGSIQDDSYYFIAGNATVQNVSGNNVIVFSTGMLTVRTGTVLTNTILIGVSGVQFQGNGTITAPLPSPAVISGGDVTRTSGRTTIYGTIYSEGTINVNPIDVHGALIGAQVEIQGSSTYTDDHATDPNYLKYYAFMPGFTYPSELKTAVTVFGGWREIQ